MSLFQAVIYLWLWVIIPSLGLSYHGRTSLANKGNFYGPTRPYGSQTRRNLLFRPLIAPALSGRSLLADNSDRNRVSLSTISKTEDIQESKLSDLRAKTLAVRIVLPKCDFDWSYEPFLNAYLKELHELNLLTQSDEYLAQQSTERKVVFNVDDSLVRARVSCQMRSSDILRTALEFLFGKACERRVPFHFNVEKKRYLKIHSQAYLKFTSCMSQALLNANQPILSIKYERMFQQELFLYERI